MRKHRSGLSFSDSPSGDIDIRALLSIAKEHWKLYALVGLFGAMVALVYLHKTLPRPESYMHMEVGFKGVKRGVYPDRSVFNKNEIINPVVLKNVQAKVEELAKSPAWSGGLSSFLMVEEIYPIELQMMKNQLHSKDNGGLKPEEVVVNYNKILQYNPTQFNILFSPNPPMPEKLREKVLDRLSKEFSEYVLQSHINSNSMLASRLPENTLQPSSHQASLDYLIHRYERIKNSLEQSQLAASNAIENETGDKQDKNEKMSELVGSDYTESMYNIKNELDALEWEVYGQKAVQDVEGLKKSLQAQITEHTLAAEQLENEMAFRVSLAKIPSSMKIDGVAAGVGISTAASNNANAVNAAASSKKTDTDNLAGMMLTYNNQYYSLVREAKTKFDEKVLVQKELGKLQNRLKLLSAPNTETTDKVALLKDVENKIKEVDTHLNKLWASILKDERDKITNFQPPVKNYFFVHHNYSVSYKNAFLAGAAAFLIFAVAHTFYVNLTSENFDKGIEKEVPSFNLGQKTTGKN